MELTFKVTGMHCASCALSIDLELEELKGITSVRTSFPKEKLVVAFDPDKVTTEQIIKVVKKLGYSLEQSSH